MRSVPAAIVLISLPAWRLGCSGAQVSAEGSSSGTQDVMSHFSNKSPVSSQKPEH